MPIASSSMKFNKRWFLVVLIPMIIILMVFDFYRENQIIRHSLQSMLQSSNSNQEDDTTTVTIHNTTTNTTTTITTTTTNNNSIHHNNETHTEATVNHDNDNNNSLLLQQNDSGEADGTSSSSSSSSFNTNNNSISSSDGPLVHNDTTIIIITNNTDNETTTGSMIINTNASESTNAPTTGKPISQTVSSSSSPSQSRQQSSSSSQPPSSLPTSNAPSSTPSRYPISFVEGTKEEDKILRDHPHRGATDEHGRYGYIANTTRLRQWMLQRYCTIVLSSSSSSSYSYVNGTITTTIIRDDSNNNSSTMLSCSIPFANLDEMDKICNTEIKKGVEGNGWDLIKDIVNIPVEDSMLLIDPQAPKILCSIYTYHKKDYLMRAIAETWGWRCDGFFAASTKTTTHHNMTEQLQGQSQYSYYEPPPTEMINLLHEGEEMYHNMWQKTRSILTYMYDHYLNDYDYFYVSGDDTHVIVENLKRFLIQYEHNETQSWNQYGKVLLEPDVIFFSGQIMKARGIVHMGGGGGYVISRLALKRFVEDAMPYCSPNAIVSAEDRFLSNCFTKFLNVTLLDAADINGKQRFHGTNPDWIATGRSEQGYFAGTIQYWASIHGVKTRSELVSPNSVSFHFMKTVDKMKRHHIILYYNSNHSHYRYDPVNHPNVTGSCPLDSVLYKALS